MKREAHDGKSRRLFFVCKIRFTRYGQRTSHRVLAIAATLFMNYYGLIHGAGARPARIATAAARSSSPSRGCPTCRGPNTKCRKLLVKLSRLTLGASGFRRPLDQQFKLVIAFPADIFEDRHSHTPFYVAHYKVAPDRSQREDSLCIRRTKLSRSDSA